MVEVVHLFLAPAIMFSAGGLLCLAQFARFTALLGQLRSFNRERLELIRNVADVGANAQEVAKERFRGLEVQAGEVLEHARTVRNALRFLVGGILLMVLCSLTFGASTLYSGLESVALGFFVLGLISIFVALCLVLAELRVSLDAVTFEHENVNRIRFAAEVER